MRWVLGAGIGIACVAGACLLPELSDFDGAPLGDAAIPIVDASGDAPAKDAGSNPDTGLVFDAGPPDARAPCPDASFCDDFDLGLLGAKWTSKAEQDGVLTLETGGLSAPNRLVVTMKPLNLERFASLTKTVTVSRDPSRVVCAVSVRIDGRPNPPDGDFQFLEVLERSASTSDDVYLKIGQTDVYLREETVAADGGVGTRQKALLAGGGALADGVWTRVTLDVNFTAKTATVTTAPASGTGGTATTPITPATKATSFDIVLGDPGDHDDGPTKASFDDLRCDFTL